MSVIWPILSKVEFLVGGGWGGVGGFGPNILSLLILIEIRIRIENRL